jgi:hypothetical protein
LTDEKEWAPTGEKCFIVLGELLSRGTPRRFNELLAACQGRISRRTFVKNLNELEARKLILKETRSHKFVEYKPNLDNPFISQFHSRLEITRQQLTKKIDTIKKLTDILTTLVESAKRLPAKKRRRVIRVAATIYALQLTLAVLDQTFWEAEIEAKYPPCNHWFMKIRDDLETERLTIRRGLADLFRKDAQETWRSADNFMSSSNALSRVIGPLHISSELKEIVTDMYKTPFRDLYAAEVALTSKTKARTRETKPPSPSAVA